MCIFQRRSRRGGRSKRKRRQTRRRGEEDKSEQVPLVFDQWMQKSKLSAVSINLVRTQGLGLLKLLFIALYVAVPLGLAFAG